MSLLIVEDNFILRDIYKRALCEYGFKTLLSAEDGEEAIKLYNSLAEKPDLILMDYQMPKKDGLEATKEILNLNKYQKIVFISKDKTIKDEAFSLGAFGFEDKPLSINDLYDLIKRVLEINYNIEFASIS